MKKELITLIIPCYNEEESVELFVKEINKLKKDFNVVDFELLFVDDGSKDKTIDIIKELAKKDSKIKYISFAKNFGKEYAMIAGFDAAKGDYVAVIDADLQHPPQLIVEMYNIIVNEGYDCVAAKSVKRNYSFIRKSLTNVYYKIINSMTEVEMRPSATDYRLMKRNMVDALKSHREHNRYLKGLFEVTGFKTKWIDYEDNERVAGTTKWNIRKLFKYAITGIISFSQAPLILLLYFGLFLVFVTFVLLLIMLILYLCNVDMNYMLYTTITCVVFLSSITLCSNGILGLYISQIQTESKKRPLYIIREDNLD